MSELLLTRNALAWFTRWREASEPARRSIERAGLSASEADALRRLEANLGDLGPINSQWFDQPKSAVVGRLAPSIAARLFDGLVVAENAVATFVKICQPRAGWFEQWIATAVEKRMRPAWERLRAEQAAVNQHRCVTQPAEPAAPAAAPEEPTTMHEETRARAEEPAAPKLPVSLERAIDVARAVKIARINLNDHISALTKSRVADQAGVSVGTVVAMLTAIRKYPAWYAEVTRDVAAPAPATEPEAALVEADMEPEMVAVSAEPVSVTETPASAKPAEPSAAEVAGQLQEVGDRLKLLALIQERQEALADALGCGRATGWSDLIATVKLQQARYEKPRETLSQLVDQLAAFAEDRQADEDAETPPGMSHPHVAAWPPEWQLRHLIAELAHAEQDAGEAQRTLVNCHVTLGNALNRGSCTRERDWDPMIAEVRDLVALKAGLAQVRPVPPPPHPLIAPGKPLPLALRIPVFETDSAGVAREMNQELRQTALEIAAGTANGGSLDLPIGARAQVLLLAADLAALAQR